MSSLRRIKLSPLLVSSALVFCFGAEAGQAFAQRMPEAAKGPSVAWHAPVQGNPGDYVGWETCAGCHRAEAQIVCEDPPRARRGGAANFPYCSRAGNLLIRCGGEEDL